MDKTDVDKKNQLDVLKAIKVTQSLLFFCRVIMMTMTSNNDIWLSCFYLCSGTQMRQGGIQCQVSHNESCVLFLGHSMPSGSTAQATDVESWEPLSHHQS